MPTPSRASPPPPPKAPRLYRLGTRRLARAHLTLGARPQIARLGRQALQAICDVLGRELNCSVTATARLAEAVVTPKLGLPCTGAFVLLDLSGTGGSAVLELDPSILFAALERLSGSRQQPSPATRFTRLEEATFAYVILSALAAVRPVAELHHRFVPRLSGVTLSREEALSRLEGHRPHLSVELALTVGQVSAGGRLLLPAVVCESVWKHLPAEQDSTLAPEILGACLGARCFFGSARLSLSALGVLSAGDVIVFQGARHGGEQLLGRGRLVTRGFELAGEFIPEGFSFTRARKRALPKEASMSTVVDPSEGVPPLPVDVEIELTRLMLPLSELAALKPGHLLPLRINASEPVLLRIGDRAVASAELVDIEGEVGARILSLLP